VAGWLHTEINVRHRQLNLDTVTHLGTNRARALSFFSVFFSLLPSIVRELQ